MHPGAGPPAGPGAPRREHPGMADYPSDGSGHRTDTGRGFGRHDKSNPSGNRYLPPLGSERHSPYTRQSPYSDPEPEYEPDD